MTEEKLCAKTLSWIMREWAAHMDAMQQRAISQAASRLEDLERQRIQAARKRIDSGEYGY